MKLNVLGEVHANKKSKNNWRSKWRQKWANNIKVAAMKVAALTSTVTDFSLQTQKSRQSRQPNGFVDVDLANYSIYQWHEPCNNNNNQPDYRKDEWRRRKRKKKLHAVITIHPTFFFPHNEYRTSEQDKIATLSRGMEQNGGWE